MQCELCVRRSQQQKALRFLRSKGFRIVDVCFSTVQLNEPVYVLVEAKDPSLVQRKLIEHKPPLDWLLAEPNNMGIVVIQHHPETTTTHPPPPRTRTRTRPTPQPPPLPSLDPPWTASRASRWQSCLIA